MKRKFTLFNLTILSILLLKLQAQNAKITDYVLFGGWPAIANQSSPPAPGYAVQMGSAGSIQSGNVGSYFLIKSTGNQVIKGNVASGNFIDFANSSTVTGKITAANSSASTGLAIKIGSSASISGSIDSKGNVSIGGGTVSGKVTVQSGFTYTGPTPGQGLFYSTPTIPALPAMPLITNFPAAGNTNVTNNTTLQPGSYGDMTLSGNKTVTFSGPGVYVFKSIKNSGTSNTFNYDFKNQSAGDILIYVHGDVDVNKVKSNLVNGGHATRVFCEIHGNGSTSTDGSSAFTIANGSAGQNSKWIGTIWAPYGAIKIGSGTGSTDLTGALWSGTQVNISGGGDIVLAAYPVCENFANANAGIDKPLEFGNATILNGTSTTPGANYSWTTSNGGVISSNANAANITVSAAGTYVLTVSASGLCAGTDTAIVTGKLTNIIGSELESVFKNGSTSSPFFIIDNGKILIDVIAVNGQYTNALNVLTSVFNMTNMRSNGSSNFIITGFVPISVLPLLNSRPDVFVYCRPFYNPVSNAGLVQTAGDAAMKSDLVRGGYNLTGDGVKVGVLSDSYATITSGGTNPITNTAAQDVSNDDLPANVTVLQDAPIRRSDEGRGMLQIVHDIAPKAQLYFRQGFTTAGDMAQGIIDLRNAGCDHIMDDITYITEPFLKDGIIANAVNNVVASGASYFSAAGNFGNKSYENAFSPTAAPAGLTGKAHNFGGGDIFQNVTLAPGDYTIVLQWVDNIYSQGEPGTQHDVDIYLTPNTNGTALFGFNRNNTNGDPIEFLPFTVNATTNTNILIINNNPTSNPARIKYIVFKGNITFNEYSTGNSTLVGQANASGAIAVAASRYNNISSVESFSSRGGTQVNGVVRSKPDITGPNGGNTTVNLGSDFDGDGYSNFFGTSAAAPHVAAVAALISEGRKKYLLQNTTSPATIKSILQSTAIDINTAGFDYASGSGFVNADAALRSFALPLPDLNALSVPSGTTPGVNLFTLTLTGNYFSPSSVVYMRETPLVTTYVNAQQLTVQMPAFIGNPGIHVYTAPISVSGLDGGHSDTLYFFSQVKKNVVVTATNFTKKYAQQMPVLTATITVDNVPLAQSGLNTTQLGLQTLSFNTVANENSEVGTYSITPVRTFDPTNQNDKGYLELYNYSFTNGSITVEALELTISANNMSAVYGEKLPNINYGYNFNSNGISNPTALLNSIRNGHTNSIAKDGNGNDVLGVVNSAPVSIVNGASVNIVNGTPVNIVNGTPVAIVNGLAVNIVNAQAINIVNGEVASIQEQVLNSDQINNLNFQVTEQTLQHARQQTNKKLVNGTYVNQSTQVIDIAQESLLDFNANSAQTNMLPSQNSTNAKGIVDQESYANGTAINIVNTVNIVNGAITIVNAAINIVNGISVTIVNGAPVTIVNGQAVTIVNGTPVAIVNGSSRSAVILEENEIGNGVHNLKSLNTVTGLGVGTQHIMPGSFNNPNFKVNYVPGILNISPAPVIITPAAGQTKVFGSSDPTTFGFTNNALLTGEEFTGSLARTTGESVGNYAYNIGTLSAGANYSLSVAAGSPTFSITSKGIVVTPTAGQSKEYGSSDPVFTYASSDPNATFTGALSRVAGNNVNTYAYTIGSLSAGPNYTITLNSTNTFAITKATLTVKADDAVINKGDALPTFTSTFTGIKYNDIPTVSYSVNPNYTGEAGMYTIIPQVTGIATTNYTITTVNGTLYVNPKGPGTKKLRSSLDCVFEVPNPAPGTFRYIARFRCINDNGTVVYVPYGPDNQITSNGGSFDASNLPKIFLPGTTTFDIPFDGVKITWQLRTYESNHKSATATDASSTSGRCSDGIAGTTLESRESNNMLTIYPNPAYQMLTIKNNELIKDIDIIDMQGKIVSKIKNSIETSIIQVDIHLLVSGVYFVKVRTQNGTKSELFIKR